MNLALVCKLGVLNYTPRVYILDHEFKMFVSSDLSDEGSDFILSHLKLSLSAQKRHFPKVLQRMSEFSVISLAFKSSPKVEAVKIECSVHFYRCPWIGLSI